MLAFPCNQFSAQEPGTDAEVHEFATSKWHVNFPMFAKIEVNGDGASELYRWLKAEQPLEDGSADIRWNFEKFLVDGHDKVVARFAPLVTPEEINVHIAALLDAP